MKETICLPRGKLLASSGLEITGKSQAGSTELGCCCKLNGGLEFEPPGLWSWAFGLNRNGAYLYAAAPL